MEGCGLNCMKYLLFVFNFIIWLGGLGMLALGIILYFGIEDWVPIDDIAMILDSELLRSSAFILIGAGALVFLLAFCGCCGAIMESKCLLVLYFLILMIVFCAQLGAGILASIYSDEVQDALEEELVLSFQKTYNGTENEDITEAWRATESILECCGYDDPDNYLPTAPRSDVNGKPSPYSYYNNSAEAEVYRVVPKSCCEGSGPNDFEPLNKNGCIDGTVIFDKGCKNGVKNLIDDYAICIGAGAIGIACVELFCMLFAICLCRNIEDSD